MNIKGIIFDLDQTIVDSSVAEPYRKIRNWGKVYSLIPSFQLYDGFEVVFGMINMFDIKCCIVTNSPSKYASMVVEYFGIPCEFIVGYHDVKKKKPNPEPFLLAADRLNLSPEVIVSIGDSAADIIASNSANIKSIACMWGTNEEDELLKSNPSLILNQPSELLDFCQ